jgi:hypothetical protein
VAATETINQFLSSPCWGVQAAPSPRKTEEGASPPTSIDELPGGKGLLRPPKSGFDNNLSIGWVAARGPLNKARCKVSDRLEGLAANRNHLGSEKSATRT